MTKILLIEDDPVVQVLILKLLKSEGFEAIAAVNGQEGLSLAQKLQPDLILCDVMMPVCDGYEVLHHLSQDPLTAGIPFIFLTAKTDHDDYRRGMEEGADDYLYKPFQRDELLGAITARLAKHQATVQPLQRELKRTTANLERLTYQDNLTQLPNRKWFLRELDGTLQKTGDRQPLTLAVLTIALEWPPEWLNHPSASTLVRQVAERMEQSLDREHSLAYLGNNRFGMGLRSLTSDQEGEQIGRSMIRLLQKPFQVGEASAEPAIYVGVAYCSPELGAGADLLLQAEMALKRTEKPMEKRLATFDPRRDVLWTDPQVVAQELERAHAQKEFVLQYQPRINLVTGKIIGAEALLRWQHPTKGMLRPGSFLAIAREHAILPNITEWVMRTAFTQAKRWQSQYHLSLQTSINLLVEEVQVPNFFENTAKILKELNISPDLLILELSESDLMPPSMDLLDILKRLRHTGMSFYMDDVGTGFSSFEALKKLPLTALKIDPHLISSIGHHEGDENIVRAAIAIAHNLNLKAIAEGVETEEQRDFLRANGCHAAQGAFFSPSLSVAAFETLLVANRL
jgi:EAL domain-containing protein (putative c-di-GMP-specific phosphodiesterase class I)/DNA-binding NarL/FixJ family response regulator